MAEASALGILAEIAATKRAELAKLASRRSELEELAAAARPARSFASSLLKGDRVAVIAECKRRSPGAGPIRPDLDPARLAAGYEAAGVSCMSVLTDRSYFGGSSKDLVAARSATRLPTLRKDFTLDPLHLLEARAMGADAVLLIVRILPGRLLDDLHREALALGLDVLVEVHDGEELDRALDLGAELVGINNRDLSTFTTRLDTTLALLERVPDDVTLVSESGIRNAADVAGLGEAGVDAVLVGESVLRADDPGDAARELAATRRRERRSRLLPGPEMKICGIQRQVDARLAARLGASYLGVIASDGFGRSVDPERAARMFAGTTVPRVAVMVDEPPEEAERRARALGADVLQLHGSETPEEVRRIADAGDWDVWKGVRADGAESLCTAAARYASSVSGFVVEGAAGKPGDGGAELGVEPKLVREVLPAGAKFVLAGGLVPDNVAAKTAAFAPDAVDVSSGIESRSGGKDAGLLRAFAAELANLGTDV